MNNIPKNFFVVMTTAIICGMFFRIAEFFANNSESVAAFIQNGAMSYNAWFESVGFYLFVVPMLLIAVISFFLTAYRSLTGKKSYEDTMQVYDNAEAKEVILSEKLSLEELLTDDGEIPDHLLKDLKE